MSEKKQDHKILFLKNYLQKKKELLENKKNETPKTDSKDQNNQHLSSVIDLSTYLKSKGMEQKPKESITHQEKLAPVISFSQYANKLTPKQTTLTRGENNVIFLNNYLKRKKFSSIFTEEMEEKAQAQEINHNAFEYKWMSRVAAAAFMVLASTVFFQSTKTDRQIASAESMNYTHSQQEESSSALEYAEYIRANKLVVPESY